jgi:integrase
MGGIINRMTLLPSTLIDPLKAQIAKVEHIHQKDLAEGQGKTSLSAGLARKYPYAITELKWQYIFPSVVRCQHPTDGYFCSHHLHLTALSKVLRKALIKTNIHQRVTAHTFKHSFAKKLL